MLRKFKLRTVAKVIINHLRKRGTGILFPYADYPVNLTQDELTWMLDLVEEPFGDDPPYAVPVVLRDDGAPIVLMLVVGFNLVEVWNVVYHQCTTYKLDEEDPTVLPALRAKLVADSGITLEEHPEPLPETRELIRAFKAAEAESR